MIKRSSGILMPVFSLPSPYGIGTLGKAAYDFVDFLSDANQSWWQMLPLGPTGYGNSPYTSFSTFAGNPLLIDLDMLIEDGLLEKSDVQGLDFGKDPSGVDYDKVEETHLKLLRKAVSNVGKEEDREFFDFRSRNLSWLSDYALYMALKDHFKGEVWMDWEDEEIRLHRPEAVARYAEMLKDDVFFHEYVQYLFYKQWDSLRKYANEARIGIIGDIPIYVALDSADVWADPRQFQLDEKNCPKEVSGVPPDYFSEEGQLWGNPLYNWDFMKSDGFGWWIRRIEGAQRLYDIIRIDHFRGFESYWAVPYGEKTARNGHWVKGPGMDLVGVLKNWFWNIQFIAEDLGFLTDEVRNLLRDSGFPGMKILQFAFDSREPSNYLPHTYDENCVCYIGTHDNTTVMAWKEETRPEDLAFAKRYLGLNEEEGLVWGLVRGGMCSPASLFIAQLQDYLELGIKARMNVPGTVGENWQWRMTKGALTEELTERIAETTRIYGRSNDRWLKSFYET